MATAAIICACCTLFDIESIAFGMQRKRSVAYRIKPIVCTNEIPSPQVFRRVREFSWAEPVLSNCLAQVRDSGEIQMLLWGWEVSDVPYSKSNEQYEQ